MALLEVRRFPDPVLLRKCDPVKAFDNRLRSLVEDMYETMYESKGCGLAAPQVGVSQRFFVLNCEFKEKGADAEITMINPEIIEGHDPEDMQEGCLSFPGIWAEVNRFKRVRARYVDIKGVQHEIEAEGLLAQAIQHELEHLDGKVFVSKLMPAEYAKVAEQVELMKRDWKRKQAKAQ